jgi:hypothetical protein
MDQIDGKDFEEPWKTGNDHEVKMGMKFHGGEVVER